MGLAVLQNLFLHVKICHSVYLRSTFIQGQPHEGAAPGGLGHFRIWNFLKLLTILFSCLYTFVPFNLKKRWIMTTRSHTNRVSGWCATINLVCLAFCLNFFYSKLLLQVTELLHLARFCSLCIDTNTLWLTYNGILLLESPPPVPVSLA